MLQEICMCNFSYVISREEGIGMTHSPMKWSGINPLALNKRKKTSMS